MLGFPLILIGVFTWLFAIVTLVIPAPSGFDSGWTLFIIGIVLVVMGCLMEDY